MPGLIVHEWVERNGGAEKVLDSFAAIYSDADIFCLWSDAPGRYEDSRIEQSALSRTRLRGNKALALPLMPYVWRRKNIEQYDWVLASSHLFAHHVGRRADRKKSNIFAYVHSPARYIWENALDTRGKNPMVKIASPYYRSIDRARASDGVRFAANSAFVRNRIRRVWGQDSVVINPPVAVEFLQSIDDWSQVLTAEEREILKSLPADFVLGASRFVPYKGLDLVIKFGESIGVPVVLAGHGPQERELRRIANEIDLRVEFISRPSDALLYALYQKALAFIFPPIEDFGIMPVEAMVLGTPVLVNAVGGAAESASDMEGGVSCDFRTDLNAGELLTQLKSLDMTRASKRTLQYSEERFRDEILSWMGV